MIEKLTLQNYRNLHTGTGLTFDPLTIFVGPNGSGKTNLIRVLRFLQDAWINAEDDRRGVSRFESAIARWGSGRILDKSVDTPSVVSVDAHFCLEHGYRHGFGLDLDIKNENTVSVRHETMRRWPDTGNQDEAFKYYDADIVAKHIVVSRYRDDMPGRRSKLHRIEALPANELAVHNLQKWLEENSDEPTKDTPFFEGKRWIEDYVSKWAFYDASQMNIDAIRKASPEIGLGDRTLAPSGTNLALVIFNLFRDLDLEDKIKQAMTELFPQTRSLRTNIVGRVSLTLEWHLLGISKPLFLDEMSEGTIRMLCWAAILFSPEIPRLLVLDEPEASLHPAWLRILAGWIRDAARRTQIIVSTHSSDLLDYFTDEIASVRVFDQDPDNPIYSHIRTVTRAAIADKLSEGWRLGDLYRVGDPQVGGWP
jgi:predicted ATPase